MNNHLIIFGIAVLLLAVGLSGCIETDTDGDGYNDEVDVFPNDDTEWMDSDGDGIGDNSDAFPNDSTEYLDTDKDGVGDKSDEFPNDSSEWLDSDGDGYGDNSDAFPIDSNLHEKKVFGDGLIFLNGEFHSKHSPFGYGSAVQNGPGLGEVFTIESDWKYLACDWYAYESVDNIFVEGENPPLFLSQGERIAFQVITPEGLTEYNNTINSNGRQVRIPITLENWGEWFCQFWFENLDINAYISYDLYTVK